MLLFLVFLVASIGAAHAIGWLLVERYEVEPGHVREVMPTIPVAPLEGENAAGRWRRGVRRVEDRLLEEFEGGVTEVSAKGLAAELGEHRRVVAGALERMREEVDCRIRVTRSGTMFHDFSADQIEKLRAERMQSLPIKLFMFGVAAASNIGAIWPVLTILFLAVASLEAMARHADAVQWGAYGIGMIVVVFGATFALSWMLHLVMSPRNSGPDLGPMETTEAMPDRRAEDAEPTSDSGGVWFYFGGSGTSSSGGGSDVDGGDSGGSGLGQAIVIIILIAIIVLCLITIYIWLRGLWRAVVEGDEQLDRTSPAFWVRTADAVDSFEKWVPTNDLVGRSVRALRRAYSHRRPVDDDLGPRTLARAKRSGGVVSALEVALEEGLDLSEATEVGAELCSIVGGEIVIDDAGELGFAFPKSVLAEIDEHAGLRTRISSEGGGGNRDAEVEYDHLWAEYLSFEQGEPYGIERRTSLYGRDLPVNLVGLGWGHVSALDRLVGGTWIMAVTGSYLALWGPPAPLEGYLVPFRDTMFASVAAFPLLTTFLLVAMAVGATCLSGATRYTVQASARHGVRRDIRRATFHAIDAALEQEREHIRVHVLRTAIYQAFDASWPDLSEELVDAEIRGVLVDLEIEYDLDAPSKKAGEAIDLESLRRRWLAVREEGFETVFGDDVDVEAEPDEDEVVFDTRVEHDHVTALA